MLLSSSTEVASNYSNDILGNLDLGLILNCDDSDFVEANYNKGKGIYIATKNIIDNYSVILERDAKNITTIADELLNADLSMKVETQG